MRKREAAIIAGPLAIEAIREDGEITFTFRWGDKLIANLGENSMETFTRFFLDWKKAQVPTQPMDWSRMILDDDDMEIVSVCLTVMPPKHHVTITHRPTGIVAKAVRKNLKDAEAAAMTEIGDAILTGMGLS